MKKLEDLSLTEIKNLILKIFEIETKKYDLDVELFLLTNIEYYKKDIFLLKNKLTKTSNIRKVLVPIINSGIYSEKKIILFTINEKKFTKVKSDKFLINLLISSYHELWHAYREKLDYKNNSFYNFIFFIENIIKSYPLDYMTQFDYFFHHDEYFSEIEANLYSIKRTEEFIQNNSKFYFENKSYIDKIKDIYSGDYFCYDFLIFFEKFYHLYKNNYKNIPYKNTILEIFFDEEANFLDIKQILFNSRLINLDNEIVELILASYSFINKLDFIKLNIEEKKFIESSLIRIYNLELARRDYIKKRLKIEKKSFKSFIKKQTFLFNRNLLKDYYDSIPNILEELNISKKKSNLYKIKSHIIHKR